MHFFQWKELKDWNIWRPGGIMKENSILVI